MVHNNVIKASLKVRGDGLLMLTSVVWGFAFVFQRMGMEHVGPFIFNGIRFALAAGALWIVLQIRRPPPRSSSKCGRGRAGAGILLGLVLFIAASLQQVGIVYTTAGNAGFITGLYVILVPALGIFMGFRTRLNVWMGAFLAAAGMYFLSVTREFTVSTGDLLVLASAVFWALHVLLVGRFSPGGDSLRLAIIQGLICSVLSLVTAVIFEDNTILGIWKASIPILYGGIVSVGIGYTLQIIGQKTAPPGHAAIILSLEAVFAVIGGTIMLAEALPVRKILGCALMLTGMLLAQMKKQNRTAYG